MTWSFKEYYEKNKNSISARRKRLYEDDPEYRDRVLTRNRTNRQAKRLEQAATKYGTEQRIEHGKFFSENIDGVTYFTIGALAGVLGCTRQAIRGWERSGLLPESLSIRKGGSGVRLYSLEHIQQIQKLLLSNGKLDNAEETRGPRLIWREVLFSGRKRSVLTPLYRLGQVSERVNRAVFTLTRLEHAGVLPRTPLLLPVGLAGILAKLPEIDAILEHTHITLKDASDLLSKHKSILGSYSIATSKEVYEALQTLSGERDTRGSIRLYTEEMVETLKKGFTELLHDSSDVDQCDKFTKFVVAGWSDQGVFGAKLLFTTEDVNHGEKV